jgi:hypothetical protein
MCNYEIKLTTNLWEQLYKTKYPYYRPYNNSNSSFGEKISREKQEWEPNGWHEHGFFLAEYYNYVVRFPLDFFVNLIFCSSETCLFLLLLLHDNTLGRMLEISWYIKSSQEWLLYMIMFNDLTNQFVGYIIGI